MVPADLKFTQEISTRFHIAASVALQLPDGPTEKFQYDRYPRHGMQAGMERFEKPDGIFARQGDSTWKRSGDWGKTGDAVEETISRELDTDENIVATPFRPPTYCDKTQGGTVWRFLNSTSQGSKTYYTFEESREHPKTGMQYPQYTFMKAPHDADGRLFLCNVAANLRDGVNLLPVNIHLVYLVSIPAGSRIEVYDQNTHQKKGRSCLGSEFRLGNNE